MNRIIKALLLLLLLFSGTQKMKAQDVVASLSIDTNAILIGKPVTVLVQLSQPKSMSINWPLFTDSMGQLEILQVMPVDTVKIEDENIVLRSQTITITSFDSGTFVIPEIVFQYKLPSSEKLLSAATDPLSIQVFTVPVDTTAEIMDIRPVEDAPFDPMILVWIVLIYHAVLVLIGLAVWYIRRKNKSTEVTDQQPAFFLPAHIIALDALADLEGEKLWQKGLQKVYFTRLTDILRLYIQHRWMIGAPELTTDEILSNSFVMTLDKASLEELERVLRLADLVKFAKMQPTSVENEDMMRLSMKFVSDTALPELENTKTLKEA